MFTLVAPPIRGPHIPIALHSLPTACPESLIPAPTGAVDLGAVVVVGDGAAAVVVLDVEKGLVAAGAVQQRGRGESGEEGGEEGEGEWGGGYGVVAKVGEEVVVYDLWGYGEEKGAESGWVCC